MPLRRLLLVVPLALAGCGSASNAELPPAASPARSPALSATPAGQVVAGLGPAQHRHTVTRVEDGRALAVLSRRARRVDTLDAQTRRRLDRAPVGVGPTNLVSDGRSLLYVVDTAGDGLVVLHTRPRLEVTRRVALPGGAPYGIAIDRRRGRLWVTLTRTNELVELAAGSRPRPLRRFPAVRQPDAVAVDDATGRVTVTGLADGVRQRFDPPRTRRAR